MQTRYSPVGDENESRQRCDDETFSDIETSSTIDEKDPQQSKPRDWKHLRHLAITTMVLAILLTVILVFGVAFRSKSTERKGPVPNLPTEAIIFGNYSDYSAAPTIENNVMWMDLLGPGMGFVSIKDPEQYGLLDGVSNPHMPPNVQNYGVSMYHQLHCLMMIRTLYWQALRGDRNLKMAENDGLEEEMVHVNHCFDYIRQGIMCAGDMSIEAAADERNGEGPHISGVGMKHECKSWDASRKWMDENLPAR
ncbi:hypothetical protein BKA61DRAFT_85129 [Leptodontidium sp. MPI-SDFR-AT-0119]|nr:hypothetical protein BKA61DRAFT_85129 [Leptodontidium sp. MPI-SDFR-AT-0119]